MPANFLHGVETIELSKGPRPIRGVKTAVIGIVGTAPMVDVAAGDRTLNTPRLVLNDRDAAKYFGADRPGFTIPQALNAIFSQGNGPICVVVNVLDPATDVTTVTDEAATVGTDNLASLAYPQVSSVVVKHTTGTPTYVLDTDYTVDAAAGTIRRLTTGSIAAAQSLKVSYSWLDPSKALAADIIGTTDGSGNRTGFKAMLDCYARFGFFPKILIAPGFSSAASVFAEMDAIAGKIRAISIADVASGTTVQDAITGRGAGGTYNTSSKRTVFCYPYAKRYNSATDSEETVPYSQYAAGVLAAKDAANGYWWSLSNTEIKGITGVERQLTAMVNDPTSEVNMLNEVGLVTIFNSFGTGYRTWGNRSAAFPTNTEPTNFICVQRTADVIHESVEYAMLQFLDYPINDALIDAIAESVNAFIRTLMGRGALIDGRCFYDPAKNPVTEIAAGHLTFDIEFMPPTPAERITFESYINIDLLKNLGTGQ